MQDSRLHRNTNPIHINWHIPSCIYRHMIEGNFFDLKESRQQTLLLPSSQSDHRRGASSGLASQETWQAAKGLVRWRGPPAGNTAGNSWDTALRKLKLRLPMLPQPSEIVLYLENKTDEKRVI